MQKLLFIDIIFLTLYCFFSVLFIIYFFINKRKDFLSYAIYLLLLSTYYVLFSVIGQEFNIVYNSNNFQNSCFKEILAAITIATYVIFIIQFLELKRYSVKMLFFVRAFLYINLISIPLILFFFFFNIEHKMLFYVSNCVIGVSVLLILYNLVLLKIPYSIYVLIGAIILIVGGVCSIVLSIFKYNATFWPTQIAVLLDVFLFNFGLQKKSKEIEQQYMQATLNRQLVIVNERERIIADLHDDLGSSISILKINSEMLQNENLAPQQKLKIINKIVENSNALVQQMNTVVWSLNSENDTLQSFIDYVKLYCYNFFENTNIQFSYEEKNILVKDLEVTSAWRKNLFFVIKEILNNTIKHSNATIVHFLFTIIPSKIQICITDNGVGIKNNNPFGNGLKNIEKRVSTLNGTFEIIDNNGTIIAISCFIKDIGILNS